MEDVIVTLLDGREIEKSQVPAGEIYINEKGQKVRKVMKVVSANNNKDAKGPSFFANLTNIISGSVNNIKVSGDGSSLQKRIGKGKAQLPDKTVQDGKVVINTIDGMSSWLQEIQEGQATTSATMALQSQIQVLNFVKSPTLTGMAMDTMIMSLYKAIQSSADEDERDAVRESFALMIQSFMFFNEAELQHAINENKEEGVKLLSQAGDILSKSVMSVASLALSGGTASAAGVGNVVIKNIFAQDNGQQSFFSKVISYIGDKKQIDERKRQHIDSLKNTFAMFDRYASMIGPSIILHGMLDRYAKMIVDFLEEQKYNYLAPGLSEKKITKNVVKTVNFVRNIAIGGVLGIGGMDDDDAILDDILLSIKERLNKANFSGHDNFVFLTNKVSDGIVKSQQYIDMLKGQIDETQKEHDNLGRFKSKQQLKVRKELNALMEKLHNSEQKLIQLKTVQEKLNTFRSEIDDYSHNLYRVVEKFAFDFSDADDLPAQFFSVINEPVASPPSVPNQAMYHVTVNGEAAGPFSMDQLKVMAQERRIDRDTFVWKQGMANWEKAGKVEEIASIFASIPPPLPVS